MRCAIALLSSIAVFCACAALAQDQQHLISLFVSGIGVDRTPESLPDGRGRETRTTVGAVGIGVEHRIARRTTIEASAEYRRDIATAYLASRCGVYQNTCFLVHRFEITSTPVVLLARFTSPESSRVAVSGSAGLRFVAKPSAEDVSAPSLHRFETGDRLNPEIGAGLTWRATQRLWFFADGRLLISTGARWDPRRRLNVGVKVGF